MKEIVIFAGTTEGRTLSEQLAKAGIAHTICVATEYGEIVLKPHPLAAVRQGRMNQGEIEAFLENNPPLALVDATHPFAKEITASIKSALDALKKSGMDIPYLRLNREGIAEHWQEDADFKTFETNEACAKALEETTGNILLTTGSKELSAYCISENIKKRLYVRVLPSPESLALCARQGIYGKQVIAMQGPFSRELNEAIIRQFDISCLVTKETGKTGGYQEKLEAAARTGTQVFVLARPQEEGGYSFEGVCRKLEQLCGKKILPAGNLMETPQGIPSPDNEQNSFMDTKQGIPSPDNEQNSFMDTKLEISSPDKKKSHPMAITLVGIGMGNESCLTKEAERAIKEADILLGAKRLLEHVDSKAEKYDYYQPAQIIPFLQKLQKEQSPLQNEPASCSICPPTGSLAIPAMESQGLDRKKIAVLFSGDSGCYSGCQSLYAALEQEIIEKRLQASVRILPGISSVSYLSACIGESYQDAAILSIHGKKLHNLAGRIKTSPKTFLLTSGVQDVNWLGRMLLEAGLAECEVTAGYRLSYEGQRIQKLTPLECCELREEGLYTCFIKNPSAAKRKLTHGIADEAFIRDKVPMTKEEVREVSICKLHLQEGAVVYDIGSGTGSIAAELAALSNEIQVYAIEHKKEAIALIGKNRAKFGLDNITIIENTAPKGLSELPPATHAFIGGSSGNLKDILAALRQINPKMRIVINAISMETICEIKEILSMDDITQKEALQLQVSRVKEAGSYHLVRSENPVWICAFNFCGETVLAL